MKKILFLNSSPEKRGNTARMAKELIGDHEYKTITLADHHINTYGSTLPGDEFDMILNAFYDADIVVIGSPVYWHNLSGGLRVVLDRFYGPVGNGALSGRSLFLVYQGAAPTKEMIDSGIYTISRFASMYGMKYMGCVSSDRDAKAMHDTFEKVYNM